MGLGMLEWSVIGFCFLIVPVTAITAICNLSGAWRRRHGGPPEIHYHAAAETFSGPQMAPQMVTLAQGPLCACGAPLATASTDRASRMPAALFCTRPGCDREGVTVTSWVAGLNQ